MRTRQTTSFSINRPFLLLHFQPDHKLFTAAQFAQSKEKKKNLLQLCGNGAGQVAKAIMSAVQTKARVTEAPLKENSTKWKTPKI